MDAIRILRLWMTLLLIFGIFTAARAQDCQLAEEMIHSAITQRPEKSTMARFEKATQECPNHPGLYHRIGDYFNHWRKKEIRPEQQAYFHYLATEYYAQGIKIGTGGDVNTMKKKLAFLESGAEDISEAGIRSIKPFARLNIRVFFEFNSSELTDGAQEQLDVLGRFLAEKPSARIVLEGHTDRRGGEAYNHLLSLERAESAKAYLVSKYNVPPENIETQGYGFERLANVDDPFSPQNRRVRARKLPQ